MSVNPYEEAVELLCGTFHPGLIWHPVRTEPQNVGKQRGLLQTGRFVSFWGRTNAISGATTLFGVAVVSIVERSLLAPTENGHPSLEGRALNGCWMLSPEHTLGCRPTIGGEVVPGENRWMAGAENRVEHE